MSSYRLNSYTPFTPTLLKLMRDEGLLVKLSSTLLKLDER